MPGYARMVSFEEIEKNEFNLNLPRYIDSRQAEDIQDIDGHLQGGIPVADVDALAAYWDVCPGLRHSLFTRQPPRLRRSGRRQGRHQDGDLRTPRVRRLHRPDERSTSTSGVSGVATELQGLAAGCQPKEIIAELSEGLLAHYAGKPLINHYDVYQHLMDYWAETMQDDVLPDRRRWLEGGDVPHHREGQEGQGEGQGLGLRPGPQAADRRPLLRGRAGGDRPVAGRAGKRRGPADRAGGRARRRGRLARGAGEDQQGDRHRAAEGDRRRQRSGRRGQGA